ncbi:MAG: hypothetical protein M3N57_00290 [Actinomycetota bacterium]|nr:hypothetical protein [Actinomycetota bacterium]
MEAWQYVLAAGFVLLPVVLMVVMWGQERLTARGRPVRRSWPREIRHRGLDHDAAHGRRPGQHPDTAPATAAEDRAATAAEDRAATAAEDRAARPTRSDRAQDS